MLNFVMLFVGGSCLGSFLCVVAERVPTYRSLLTPGSHCLSCQTLLRFYELIPIISICIQKFRCRHCQKRIPYSYLIAEMFGGFITGLIFANGWSMIAFYKWFLILSTFVLALADYWFLWLNLGFFIRHTQRLFCFTSIYVFRFIFLPAL